MLNEVTSSVELTGQTCESTILLPLGWYELLRQSNLFKGCSLAQLNELLPYLEEVKFNSGDIIITEGDYAKEVYLILDGRVEILKQLANDNMAKLAILAKNDSFGEMAFLNNDVRSATIKALEPVTLLKISANFLERINNTEQSTHGKLAINLASNLANHLHSTTKLTIEALKNEIVLSKSRIAAGGFIIYTITLLTIYILTANAAAKIASDAIATTLITGPFIIIYSLGFSMMMQHSHYPLSFFGFNLVNWHKNIIESVTWTLIFCAVLTLLKFILISTIPIFSTIPLLDISSNFNNMHNDKINLVSILLFFTIYTLTAPLQEFIFRGAIQSLLSDFLNGKYATFWTVLLSTMLFCIAHIHVGIWYALLVFIPGLFWGIMYAHQRSLLGPSISHILIGWWILYGLGIERFIQL
jgi:CRP-like cAMP-binding protein